MSLFRDSSQISDAEVYDKILFWGPQHSGKTHAALSWPDPAVVDLENRDAHFKDRFRFKLASVPDLETLGKVLKALKAGEIQCSSFVFDSYSAAYEKLTVEHTVAKTRDGKTSYVTDYTTVNKRDDALREFCFSIHNRNVLFIAHAQQKYDRRGDVFTPKGLDFKGQEKFRFAFDYIFQVVSNGDPRVKPPTFIVEKSASPNLKVGDQLRGLDYAKFIEITRGKQQQNTSAPPLKGEVLADAQATGQLPMGTDEEPILERQAHAIDALCKQMHATRSDLHNVVLDVTGKRTGDYLKTTSEEAAKIIKQLGSLKTAGAA